MRFKLSLLTLALIFFSAISAQDTTQFSKKCHISSGLGYANSIDASKGGASFFLQMDYQFAPQFSLAIESEHMNFDVPGYYPDSIINNNVQHFYDHYFSLLIKYHLPLNSKFHASLASGWTYLIRQTDYYDVYTEPTSQLITHRMSSFNTYGIPFLLEASYPVWKDLSAGIRAKYNFNPGYGDTYSAGVGVSLKL